MEDRPPFQHCYRLAAEVLGPWHRTALLRELIGEAERRGVRQTELDVVAENRRARGLYEKMGFRAVATLPAAIRFTDGSLHDEIHMMRST